MEQVSSSTEEAKEISANRQGAQHTHLMQLIGNTNVQPTITLNVYIFF